MFKDIAQMEKEIETFRKNVVASSELIEGLSRLTETTRQQKESFSESADALIKRIDTCIDQIRENQDSALRTLSDDNDTAMKALGDAMSQEQASRLAELERIKTSFTSVLDSCTERLQSTENAISGYRTEAEEKFIAYASQLESSAEMLRREVDSCVAQTKENQDTALQTFRQNNDAAMKALETALAQEQERRLAELERIRTDFENAQAAYIEQMQMTERGIQEYQTTAENKYDAFVQRLETTNVDQIFKEVQDLKQSFQTKFALMMGGIGVAVVIAVLGLILK